MNAEMLPTDSAEATEAPSALKLSPMASPAAETPPNALLNLSIAGEALSLAVILNRISLSAIDVLRAEHAGQVFVGFGPGAAGAAGLFGQHDHPLSEFLRAQALAQFSHGAVQTQRQSEQAAQFGLVV
jgi:hypothetical protein